MLAEADAEHIESIGFARRFGRRERLVKIEDVALEVMAENGLRHLWYGVPDAVGEIASRAGCTGKHPLTRSASVIGAVAKSGKWKRSGHIVHLGRRYNVYEPKDSPQHLTERGGTP